MTHHTYQGRLVVFANAKLKLRLNRCAHSGDFIIII